MYKGVVSNYANGKAKIYIPEKSMVTYEIPVCEHCRPLNVGDTVIVATFEKGFTDAVVIGVIR